jgi:hypothetical protein
VANGKHKIRRIFQLEQDEGIIPGQENLKTYILEFYKNLFGAPAPHNFYLVESEINWLKGTLKKDLVQIRVGVCMVL